MWRHIAGVIICRLAEQSEQVRADHAVQFRAASEAYDILGDGARWSIQCTEPCIRGACVSGVCSMVTSNHASRLLIRRCQTGGVQSIWAHGCHTRRCRRAWPLVSIIWLWRQQYQLQLHLPGGSCHVHAAQTRCASALSSLLLVMRWHDSTNRKSVTTRRHASAGLWSIAQMIAARSSRGDALFHAAMLGCLLGGGLIAGNAGDWLWQSSNRGVRSRQCACAAQMHICLRGQWCRVCAEFRRITGSRYERMQG